MNVVFSKVVLYLEQRDSETGTAEIVRIRSERRTAGHQNA